MATETQIFRKTLAEAIGPDFEYVSAADEKRHFDEWLVLHQYAGELFLVFVGAGGKVLWDHIKHEAKALGKLLGEKVWSEAKTWASVLGQIEPTKEESKQLQEMERGEDAMVALGKTLADSYFKEFLYGGKLALLKKLGDDNLPPDKAERIAAEFTKVVRSRIKR